MKRRMHGVWASALAVGLLAGGGARADDRASARPLFDEGRRLLTAGKVAEACAKFEAASHLMSTAGVRLNLAACWAKLGHTASAWAMYDEARGIADRTGDAAASEVAQKGKAELEPRLSRLTVTVAGANAVGLTVTRDGEPVCSGAWGVGLPVDPGEHEIAARAPGRKLWTTKVDVLGEGALGTVTVPVLEPEGGDGDPPPNPGVVYAPAPAATSSPSSGLTTLRTVGLVSGGVGIVGLGVGTAFAVLASSAWNSQTSDCQSPTSCANHAQAIADHNTFTTDTGVEIAGFVAGGALLAAGIVLFVAGGNAPAKTGLLVVPSFSPGMAGLTFRGGF